MNNSAASKNRRILVIDDNPTIHEDFRKILAFSSGEEGDYDDLRAEVLGQSASSPKAAGFEIDSAFQGKEGLELVQQAVAGGTPYDMAFLDVRMPPGWDGI